MKAKCRNQCVMANTGNFYSGKNKIPSKNEKQNQLLCCISRQNIFGSEVIHRNGNNAVGMISEQGQTKRLKSLALGANH